jgi:6-phosphogluconolactonase (cycloisomerase 2 family)
MHPTREHVLIGFLFVLACTGCWAQDATVSPAKIAFPSQAVGTISSVQTLTLTNPSETNALTISGIVASGMFTETNTCGSSVAAGDSCTISVRFAPTATGGIDGNLSIFDNAPLSPQVVGLTGNGIAQETLSTNSFDFGSVSVGQNSEAETINLTNRTSAAIAIGGITASGEFTATPTTKGGCGSTLAANTTCGENVVFAPTELGLLWGSLIFTVGGKQLYVNLVGHGVGTAGSPLTLTPASLTFADQGVGTTSASQSVTIKNTGATNLALTFVASGSYSKSNPATGACGSSLAAGASCTIDVQFSPAVAGGVNGGVSVSYAGTDSPQVVALSGTGVAQLTLSASSIAFGPQAAGSTSAAKTLTLTNNSGSAISLSSIVPSSEFTQTNNCGTGIAKGASCTVSVSFAPTKAGSIFGSIVVTDSAANSPQIVDLTGAGYLRSRFAYVANALSNTISIYTVNVKTGQLCDNGYVLAGSGMVTVAVDPSGRFAYGAGAGGIFAYTINAGTGSLTPVAGSPYAIPAETYPVTITVDPSGRFVYLTTQDTTNVNGSISGYSIDGATGALTVITGSPFETGEGPGPIAIDPLGKFLYVGNEDDSPGGDVTGFTIDGTTGALTTMAGSPFLSGSGALTVVIAPSGKFGYVTAYGSPITVFSINSTTGIPTQISGSPFDVPAGNEMAMAASGKFLYVLSEANVLNAYSLNTGTGAIVASIESVDTGQNPSSVTVDPTGTLLYVTNQGGGEEENGYVNDVWVYSLASNGSPTLLKVAGTQQGPASFALAGGTSSIAYTPKFAYAANADGNNVSGYTINASTGALTAMAGSPFNTGAPSGSDPSPFAISVDPSGRFAYVVDYNGNGTTGYLSGYTINSVTGALALLSSSPFAAGNNPSSVTVDPSDRFAYVANFFSNNISGYTLNSSTGSLTAQSSAYSTGANSEPTSVTIDPTGQFLLVVDYQSQQLQSFSINPSSGDLTFVGSVATGSEPKLVAADPSGQFVYVANQGGGISAFVLGPSGLLTAVSGSPFADSGQPVSIVVDPSDRFVYVANYNGASVSAFTLDQGNGTLTEITGSPFVAGNQPQSVTVDVSGSFVYAANSADNTVSVYAINQTTGALTAITGSPFAAGSRPFALSTAGTIH